MARAWWLVLASLLALPPVLWLWTARPFRTISSHAGGTPGGDPSSTALWRRHLNSPTQQQQTMQARQHPSRPRIFIYPSSVTQSFSSFRPVLLNLSLEGNFSTDIWLKSQYSLESLFPKMLHESPWVVDRPEDADFFFVESWAYYGRNLDDEGTKELLAALRSYGPWLDRRNASDHIFVLSNDVGLCGASRLLPQTSIILQHFGALYSIFETTLSCDPLARWGADCELSHHVFERGGADPSHHSLGPPHGRPCYVPSRDILLPPAALYEDPGPLGPAASWHRWGPYNATLRANRTTLAFFAGNAYSPLEQRDGYFREHPAADTFSMGVRQALHMMYKDHAGFKFQLGHSPDYLQQLLDSTFCLAPAGSGWGGRVKGGAAFGCLPVIVQPDVRVEWEHQLPLHEYAIRVPWHLLHKLPELLEQLVRSGRVPAMLRALSCAWRFHWWSHPNGRAFELTMCTLQARLLGGAVRLDTSTCALHCGRGSTAIDVLNTGPHWAQQ